MKKSHTSINKCKKSWSKYHPSRLGCLVSLDRQKKI